MKSEERYCMRMFHGMLDQRKLYNPEMDDNSELSDDADNFKFDPSRPEDVEVFNFAFLDRVARIWQNREEYFFGNKLLIEWYDCYSNIVFQFHMIELYKDNLIDVLGEDYEKLKIDEMMSFVKNCYNELIDYHNLKIEPDEEDVREMIDVFDGLSDSMYILGITNGMPF